MSELKLIVEHQFIIWNYRKRDYGNGQVYVKYNQHQFWGKRVYQAFPLPLDVWISCEPINETFLGWCKIQDKNYVQYYNVRYFSNGFKQPESILAEKFKQCISVNLLRRGVSPELYRISLDNIPCLYVAVVR